MKLLIDAGNTRLKAALLSDSGRIEPVLMGTLEEFIAHPWGPVDAVWLSAVSASDIIAALSDHLQQCGFTVTRVASEKHAFGVTNAYENPTKLGVDRWLAMVAAHNENSKHTLIVDAGTATTIDWLDASGAHLGGWIVPGVALMQSTLMQKSKLITVDEAQVGRVGQLGQTTSECVTDGCVNSLNGLVKQAIAVAETQLDWTDFRLLLTGGAYPLLSQELKRRGEERPDLVLEGLARYASEL